jgi:hypothetical protein
MATDGHRRPSATSRAAGWPTRSRLGLVRFASRPSTRTTGSPATPSAATGSRCCSPTWWATHGASRCGWPGAEEPRRAEADVGEGGRSGGRILRLSGPARGGAHRLHHRGHGRHDGGVELDRGPEGHRGSRGVRQGQHPQDRQGDRGEGHPGRGQAVPALHPERCSEERLPQGVRAAAPAPGGAWRSSAPRQHRRRVQGHRAVAPEPPGSGVAARAGGTGVPAGDRGRGGARAALSFRRGDPRLGEVGPVRPGLHDAMCAAG